MQRAVRHAVRSRSPWQSDVQPVRGSSAPSHASLSPTLSRLFARKDKLFTTPAGQEDPWQCEPAGELDYLSRSLVVLRLREPYVRWAREADPQGNADYTLVKARRQDPIAFLIPMQYGTAEDSEAFIDRYWRHFFAQALEQIEHDRARWPSPRTAAMFRHWFDIELCSAVIDLGWQESG